MKIYGGDQTSLVLTEKAKAAYDRTDPIEIHEYFEPGHYARKNSSKWIPGRLVYDITGVLVGHKMTQDELNEFLEEWADTMNELAYEMEGRKDG